MKRLLSYLFPLSLGCALGFVLMSPPVVHAATRAAVTIAQTVGLKTFVNAYDENNQPKVVELLPCPTTADVTAQITAQISNQVPSIVTTQVATAIAAIPPPAPVTLDTLLPLLASVPRQTIGLGPAVTVYPLTDGVNGALPRPGKPMLFFSSTITVSTATFVSLIVGSNPQCSTGIRHLVDNVPGYPTSPAPIGQSPTNVGEYLCLTFSVAASPGGTVTILR